MHAGRHACFEFLRSDYRSACRTAEEAVQLALAGGDYFVYMLSQFYRALALLHLGRWGEMWRTLNEGIHMAKRNGHPFWAMLFRLELAWLHVHAFDFDGARALCEQGLRQAHPGVTL